MKFNREFKRHVELKYAVPACLCIMVFILVD